VKERRRKILLIAAIASVLAAAMTPPPDAAAQAGEYLLKAGYVEKFTHFVEWPPEAQRDSTALFRIGVIGTNPYGGALEAIFGRTKIRGRRVRIDYLSTVEEIDDCLILIISGSRKDDLGEILGHAAGKPILTIGDSRGYAKRGVAINLFVDHDYIRYEINRSALKKSGLKVSSLLLSSAVLVDADD
jgi:hypothetical protein